VTPTDDGQSGGGLPEISIDLDRFATGVLAILLLNFACIVLIVVLAPLLMIPIINLSDVLKLVDTSKYNLKYDQVWRGALALFVLFSLIGVGPIQVALWGAKSFLRRLPVPAMRFTIIWAVWEVFWYYVGAVSGLDMILIIICLLFVFIRWKKIFSLSRGDEI